MEAQLTTLCQKDEALARKLAEELEKEEKRVQKLEARGRQLEQKGICKQDFDVAAQLAADIEAEERQLQNREKRDRELARKLVREASKGFMTADEETKQLSKQINGKAAEPTMRMRLREKLGNLRRNISTQVEANNISQPVLFSDITNQPIKA